MEVLVRPARKSKDADAIRVMFEQFASGRECRAGELVGTLFRSVKKDPDSRLLLVAEREGEYQGFLYAMRQYELDLFDDSTVWIVHYVYGRNVIQAFLRYMNRHVLVVGEKMLVSARAAARGKSLERIFSRAGLEQVSTIWGAQKRE